ncbi:hypothetical protein [Corynebacterium crudilactis]|uniref:Secreted protein n=1 Tax=Corynebacterium crudilactis TaxID=1652495 RepID=A0A172QX59_9CORY|nr:hypothetical protein [Corynebacterium crudilactis]ANE05303.1 hypothetical protein ccrud_05920 [Corynebacterium crudilactis]
MIKKYLSTIAAATIAGSVLFAPTAQAASSNFPANDMVDPAGPTMTSTGLNRAQETVLLQGFFGAVILSTGTPYVGECHTVTLSHQQLLCPIATDLHYQIYGR